MLIQNAQIFLGGKFTKGDILFRETIKAVGAVERDYLEESFDARGGYVIPGLVDIHTHGAAGEDFSDGSLDGLHRLSEFYAAHGVTSFLATTMTLPEQNLSDAMHAVRAGRNLRGAKCAGVHLEGPFLSDKKKGAQAGEHLRLPDIELFHRLNDACDGKVRMITVAPELEGVLVFIRAASRVCTVSLGHSASDYSTAMAAFDAGASHVTHLFNGMSPFLHREPGIVGAAFDSGASVELICDGFHIHPSVMRAMFRLFGKKVNLISDSIRCTGMPEGNYELGGQPVSVKEGRVTMSDGTLAGSSITLLDAVRNAVRFGIPLKDAVYAASTAPAKAIGLNAGKIEVGLPADLVVLDKDLNLLAVFVNGRNVSGN